MLASNAAAFGAVQLAIQPVLEGCRPIVEWSLMAAQAVSRPVIASVAAPASLLSSIRALAGAMKRGTLQIRLFNGSPRAAAVWSQDLSSI